MTTIYEHLLLNVLGTRNTLVALGIDPDWPKDSIVVTQRPKCPTCDGHQRNFTDLCRGLPTCPTCQVTGYVPDPWATVDGCLTWLFVHDVVWVQSTHHAGVAEVAWGAADLDGAETAPTLHAALIAACKAVQERQ